MATKAQIRNKALKKLRALEEGETPTNEVIDDVEAAYDELHAYLTARNGTYWATTEAIPDEAVRSMVAILAADMADDFGVDEARYARLQFEAYGRNGKANPSGGAFAVLTELANSNYISRPVTADYY